MDDKKILETPGKGSCQGAEKEINEKLVSFILPQSAIEVETNGGKVERVMVDSREDPDGDVIKVSSIFFFERAYALVEVLLYKDILSFKVVELHTEGIYQKPEESRKMLGEFDILLKGIEKFEALIKEQKQKLSQG